MTQHEQLNDAKLRQMHSSLSHRRTIRFCVYIGINVISLKRGQEERRRIGSLALSTSVKSIRLFKYCVFGAEETRTKAQGLFVGWKANAHRSYDPTSRFLHLRSVPTLNDGPSD